MFLETKHRRAKSKEMPDMIKIINYDSNLKEIRKI